MGFEEFGLTRNEAKAYEMLIKFGKSGAGEISKESGVSYSKIYNILDSLMNKGLVQIIPEKSKKFIPTNPRAIVDFLKKKQERLNKAIEEAEKLKQFYSEDKNPIIIDFGRGGFYKILERQKKSEKYDYAIRWKSEYKPEWVENMKKNIKKGLDMKDLVRYDGETKKNVDDWLKISKNIRKFGNDGVAMSIKDDEEIMISLIKSNVTMLIRDKPFVKIMKKLFLETYKNAEKI